MTDVSVTTKSSRKLLGGLHPIPVQPKLWHQVGMDLIGPMPETPRGNKYITLTDYLSKWAEAAAFPDKTANGVARFIYFVVSLKEVQVIEIPNHFCCVATYQFFMIIQHMQMWESSSPDY